LRDVVDGVGARPIVGVTMLLEPFAGLEVVRVDSPAEADVYEQRFVEAYRRIFAGEPYFEDFTEDEARAQWRRLTRAKRNITVVALEPDGTMAGFGIAIPLTEAPDVARALSGLVPVKATMYLVELGVGEAWRGKRLARHLVKVRIGLIDPELFSHVVLRVAEGRSTSFDMYRSLDFTDMGVSMGVQQRRTDGTVRGDTRHFLSRVLSQVMIDD